MGANSFREINEKLDWPLNNFYYKIDISKIKMKVIDCGNIDSILSDLEGTHGLLQDKISEILKLSSDSIVIAIGGTDDLNYPVLQATS